jgi:hypothetical protein
MARLNTKDNSRKEKRTIFLTIKQKQLQLEDI